MSVPHFCGCYFVLTPALHHWGIPTIRWLPQVALSAETTILSTTSRTVLTQTFTNPSVSDAISEATYTFPLYDGVGVVGFNCKIGKRIIRGLVKEKSKAKVVYEQAIARGETAGLLEQLPEARDVFTTKIGNIPADEKVVVEITYLGELKHDAQVDAIRFTIPTRIAPRYGELPGGILEPGTDNKSRQAESAKGIQITVNVKLPAKSSIRSIQSPSHPIAVTIGNTITSSGNFHPNKGGATLSLGTTQLEKDFVLIILAAAIVKPQALLETHPTIPNHRALMVTLLPKFALPPSRPEIVFIVDRSGSMDGCIPTVISALKVFLKSLPVGVKFNICSFGTSYSLLWQRSKTYDQSTLTEAIKHVEKFDSDFGGTEMLEPIKSVIENRYKDMALEVMMLTDGEIWNQEELFSYLNKEVQESVAPIRIFTLGIGNNVSHSLIEGIARAGNGFCQAVLLDEKLDSKVVRMLKGGLSPHVNDYSLEVKYCGEGVEAIEKVSDSLHISSISNPSSSQYISGQVPQKKKNSLFDEDLDMDQQPTPTPDPDGTVEKYAHLPDIPPPKLLQAPTHIPSLFPFSRTDVYILMSPQSSEKKPTTVVLRGTSEHGPLELEIPVQILKETAETIHQLAARKAIGELEEGRGWIFASKDDSGVPIREQFASKDDDGVPIREQFDGRWNDIIEREAVRLGVQFQVASKWCSFVAVEENEANSTEREQQNDADSHKRISESEQDGEDDEDVSFALCEEYDAGYPSASDDALDFLEESVHFTCPPIGMMPQAMAIRRAMSYWEPQSLNCADDDLLGECEDHEVSYPSVLEDGPSLVAAESESPHIVTDIEKLHELIELQSFEGAWELDEKLCSIVGVGGQEEICSRAEEKWWRALATVLAVVFLEGKLAEERNTWELVVEKGRLWLADCGVEPERVVDWEGWATKLMVAT